jgi:hypothetical protein
VATGQQCQVTGPPDTQHTANIDPIMAVDAQCNASPSCGGPLDEPQTWTGICDSSDYLPAKKTCGPNSGTMCTLGSQDCTVSLQMSALQVTGGSCPGGSTLAVTKPTPTWASLGLACGGAQLGTGCSGNQVCAPKPAPQFNSTLCVMKAGNNMCPAGQFMTPHVFYTAYTPGTRDCTPCACGATATGGSCSAMVEIYSTANCAGSPIAMLNPTTQAGDCLNITGNPVASSRKATFTTPTGGTCAITGGAPTGTLPVADATTAVTFCCQ